MSMAVCDAPVTLINCSLLPGLPPQQGDIPPQEVDLPPQQVDLPEGEDSRRDGQLDIWASIQEAKKEQPDLINPPYVHPLLKRSASFLSQKSLEICTESLGSETGSDGYSDLDHHFATLSDGELGADDESESQEEVDELEAFGGDWKKELAVVNYHCSINNKSPLRSFPPPLPSISRRDGPCLHMRPRRGHGRLVVHAVPVPSQNYLHCERQDGRLLLSFIETSFEETYPDVQDPPLAADENESDGWVVDEDDMNQEWAVDDEEIMDNDMEHEELGAELDQRELIEEGEEEEEVEVVDRGITVEVKVSRQPQLQSGGVKVHKSSLVINKFVSGTPLGNHREDKDKGLVLTLPMCPVMKPHVDVAKGGGGVAAIEEMEVWGFGRRAKDMRGGGGEEQETRFLFSGKKMMKRKDMLNQVRRCSHNQKPLFIWEPTCISTS